MALVLDRETAPFRLLSLPKSVWSEISALLDARSIAVLGCLSPAFRTFIRSSHVIAKLHILVPADSRMQLTEWPFQWFEPYPSLVSIGLSLNAKSQLRPFTPEDLAKFELVRHLYLNFADSFTDSLLPYLPPMLITLSLSKNFLITDAGIANLPIWLETLHLPCNGNLTPLCIPQLPKTLTSLSICFKYELSPETVALLPRLNWLQLGGTRRLTAPAVAALPKSLTYFSWALADPMGPMELSSLPLSVTELDIQKMDSDEETTACIPSSIKRLTILSCANLFATPPQLVSLSLGAVRSLPAGAVSLLPATLTTFHLQNLREATYDDIEALPRGLHILKLPTFELFTNAWFNALPPHLHVFHCTWNTEITDDLVFEAPKSLYRLILRVRASSAVHPRKLNPGLKYDEKTIQELTAGRAAVYPIDQYIECAHLFPRTPRYVYTIGTVPLAFDTYFFEVDIPRGTLGVHDIYPRSVPHLDVDHMPFAYPPNQPALPARIYDWVASWFKVSYWKS